MDHGRSAIGFCLKSLRTLVGAIRDQQVAKLPNLHKANDDVNMRLVGSRMG